MKPATSSFQWRALVTMTVSLSFMALVASGLVLFVAPPGRVANWTNWTLGGLLKSEWTGIHLSFSAVFLAAVGFHLFFNWRPMVSYLKNRVTRSIGFRPEWLGAGVLTAVIVGGTLAGVPPFSSIAAFSESLKEGWEQPAARAPIPHAELLSVAELAEQAKVPLEQALRRFETAGVTGAAADVQVAVLAKAAGKSAQQIYEIIAPPNMHNATNERVGGGLGWRTLPEFCESEGIVLADALARLETAGFAVQDGLTLRELANLNGQERPARLLEVIRGETHLEE